MKKLSKVLAFLLTLVMIISLSSFQYVKAFGIDFKSFFVGPRYPATIMGKYGYIDKSGNTVINATYDYASNFKDDLAMVSKDNHYGYINKCGDIAIPICYDEAYDFHEGLACIKIADKYGYVDKTGKLIFFSPSEIPSDFSDGLAAFLKNGKYGYIDSKGKIPIKDVYESVSNFSQNLAAVSLEDKWGYINSKGTFIIPATFQGAFDFKEGLAPVKINGKWGYIDKTGKVIIKPIYDIANVYSGGLAAVQTDKKWGYIDSSGKMVIKPQYAFVQNFNEGLAVVNKKVEGFDVIDKSGKVKIHYKSGNAESFHNGLLAVKIDNRLSYIDTAGKVVWKEPVKVKLVDSGYLNEVKLNPNKYTLMYYPQVSHLKNPLAQQRINDLIKKTIKVDEIGNDQTIKYTDFVLQFNKRNVLNLILYIYNYSRGAAHGMTYKKSLIFNTDTGMSYNLNSLFKDRSYIPKVNTIIKYQMSRRTDIINQFTSINPQNQDYFLTDNGIGIFFQLYQYTPYAAGFPQFIITRNQINDFINPDIPIWNVI